MACQPASHLETLRGQRYSMPCPTAKNWAPFVRGCAPEDAGANHDMRRVRLLTADGSSDDRACNSPRVVLSSRAEGHTAFGAFLLPINVPARPGPHEQETRHEPATSHPTRCAPGRATAVRQRVQRHRGREPRLATPRPRSRVVRRDRAVPERRARPPLPPRAQPGRHDRDRPPGARRHRARARHPGRRNAVPVVQCCRRAPGTE